MVDLNLKPMSEEQSLKWFNFRTNPAEHLTATEESKPDFSGLRQEILGREKHGIIYDNLDFVPFAKYMRAEDREAFSRMDTEDKVKSIMWETAGAALVFAAGPILKGAVKGARKGLTLAGTLKKRPALTPVEDVGTWTAKHYAKTAEGFLKKDLGLSKTESNAVTRALQGDPTGLKDEMLELTYKGRLDKSKLPEMIERVPGISYGEYKFTPKAMSKLDYYTPDQVRYRNLLSNFTKTAKKGEFKKQPAIAEATYKSQAKRFYGTEGARGRKLAEATEDELFAFANDLADPVAMAEVRKALNPVGGRWIRPIRQVFGYGEDTFGTYSNIYLRTVGAYGKANVHTEAKVLEYYNILAQRGFGKVKVDPKTGVAKFKRSKDFTPEVRDEIARVMKSRDELTEIAMKGGDEAIEAEAQLSNITNTVKPEMRDMVSRGVESTDALFDKVYGERMLWKIEELFERAGLSPSGRAMMEQSLETTGRALKDSNLLGSMDDIASKLRFNFSSKAGKGVDEKIDGIKQILGGYQGMLRNMRANPQISWFTAQGDDLARLTHELEGAFRIGKGGEFINYAENYLPRLYAAETKANSKIFGTLGGRLAPFYTKPRVATQPRPDRLGLEQLVHSRVRAQSKEMFVYPELEKVGKFARTLPQEWKNITEHYMGRVLGMPTRADEFIGNMIGGTVGKLERTFGGTGIWDAHRAMRLSQNINDFTHMGFLGVKPFSAMRNLFQPLLLTTADLGGIKSVPHLMRGYKTGFSKEGRKYLNSLNIITDYAPELRKTPRVFNFRPKVGGVTLPSRDEIRDLSMWMFRESDQWNRYVTGGAAMSKWDAAVAKSGIAEIRPDKFLNPTREVSNKVQGFLKRAGVNGRQPWIRAELESMVKSGKLTDAKAAFVKDVVSDTQFLYGKFDAPILSQVGGGFTRTAMIFNSWWANYGALMHKWATTGTQDVKLQRAVGWMLTQAAGMTMMKQMWSRETAARSTFFGPFPSLEKGFPLPPAWEPIAKTMGIATTAAGLVTGTSDFEDVSKRTKSLLNTAVGFVPGGLQLKQFHRGYKDDEIAGVIKSLIKFNPPEEE